MPHRPPEDPYDSGRYCRVNIEPRAMMPPLLRRCPNCRHLSLRRWFAAVDDDLVECPSCGYRFDPVDDPRLN